MRLNETLAFMAIVYPEITKIFSIIKTQFMVTAIFDPEFTRALFLAAIDTATQIPGKWKGTHSYKNNTI